MIRSVGILLAAVLLVGCQKDETIAGQTTPDTVWTLTEMNGAAIAAAFIIQFGEDGATFGQADCNRFTTTQTAPLPWFKLEPIAATKALCPNANLEMQFLNALSLSEQAEIQGDTLLLTGPNSELVFKSNG